MFNVEVAGDDIVINNRIEVGIDCSSSLCFTDNERPNGQIPVSEVADIFGWVVRDIDYVDAFGNGYMWKMPQYLLFEKNGFQLEIRQNKRNDVKWRIIKVRHNKKCKHSPKLIVGRPKLIRVSD